MTFTFGFQLQDATYVQLQDATYVLLSATEKIKIEFRFAINDKKGNKMCVGTVIFFLSGV